MPPTTPLPISILDNLEAALAGINGDPDYWYTVTYIKLGEDPGDFMTAPGLTIGDVGDIGQVVEKKEGSVLWYTNLHWRLPILGVVPRSAQPERDLLKLTADVYKAIKAHATLNSIATVYWIGWAVAAAANKDDDRPWMECVLDIHFRTPERELISE